MIIEVPVLNANNVDPDQTLRFVVSDLGLHCLPTPLLGDARHKWFNRIWAASYENKMFSRYVRQRRPRSVAYAHNLIRAFVLVREFLNTLKISRLFRPYNLAGFSRPLLFPEDTRPLDTARFRYNVREYTCWLLYLIYASSGTQISLRILTVLSESSLGALWITKDPSFIKWTKKPLIRLRGYIFSRRVHICY